MPGAVQPGYLVVLDTGFSVVAVDGSACDAGQLDSSFQLQQSDYLSLCAFFRARTSDGRPRDI